MTKLLASLLIAIVLIMSLTVTASAAGPGYGFGCGGMGGCYSLMLDDNGALLDRDSFEAKLDKAIEDGLIDAEDKEAYLEMYDYCAENGCRSNNARGGMGRGRGMGRCL